MLITCILGNLYLYIKCLSSSFLVPLLSLQAFSLFPFTKALLLFFFSLSFFPSPFLPLPSPFRFPSNWSMCFLLLNVYSIILADFNCNWQQRNTVRSFFENSNMAKILLYFISLKKNSEINNGWYHRGTASRGWEATLDCRRLALKLIRTKDMQVAETRRRKQESYMKPMAKFILALSSQQSLGKEIARLEPYGWITPTLGRAAQFSGKMVVINKAAWLWDRLKFKFWLRYLLAK